MDIQNLQHLQTTLSRVDDLIRVSVQRAQAAGHDPTDALRGLIISDDEVEVRLNQSPMSSLWRDDTVLPHLPSISVDSDLDLPFLHLIDAFQLTLLDSYILLLSAAPELDRRYERLYAYLQDDVSQRRPTVNLVMNILGEDITQRFAVWERLLPQHPLRTHHLINVTPDPSQQNGSFLGHHIKIDHRVVAYLLGDITPDVRLQDMVEIRRDEVFPMPLADDVIAPLRKALPQSPIIYMQGAESMGQVETASTLCTDYDLPLVYINLKNLIENTADAKISWRLALREGYLCGGVLFFDYWESILDADERPPIELWMALLNYDKPIFIGGVGKWEPLDIERQRPLLRVNFDVPHYQLRREAWGHFTDGKQVQIAAEDLDELAGKFRITRTQIARAVHTAADIAMSRGENVNRHDLYLGAQAHAGLRLGHHAKQITPRYTWENLILPPEQLEQLQEMTTWARYTHIVHDDWGFGKKISNMQGVSALFAGESGTGKTLSAEVLANDLGLTLYKIDLSAVVSKYIGETEKNLGVIFTEARSGNAILFFDEADALFGKRSEVKDARDRYANIEIAYLLQEIEAYDGIAILATNLRQNLDEAFTRRIDFMIDFPFPEREYRRRIWDAHFPPEAPLAADIDLDDLSNRYRLAGGNIRNIALGAAYLAAADGGIITAAHLRRAIRREHQKMGRLLEEVY